jgi:DNA-binding response OmpR family regulator
MLPGMDGIDFCRTVKTDLKTEHIPVILLTARAENDDRIEGLETGADDFIIKPFAIEELKLRIKNCIQTRIKLRQSLSKILLLPRYLSLNTIQMTGFFPGRYRL